MSIKEHRAKYSKYVTSYHIALVVRTFTIERLLKAFHDDSHFNTIPLKLWNRLPAQRIDEINGGAPCNTVCIFKEAAQQAVENTIEANKGDESQ